MSPQTHAAFLDIVLKGTRAANGMASFADVLSRDEAKQEELRHRLGDRLDVLLVLFDQVVAHREVAIRVDRALLGHQVADMAVRGQDLVVLAQVLLDGLGLGRRLDDDEILGHVLKKQSRGRPRRKKVASG